MIEAFVFLSAPGKEML